MYFCSIKEASRIQIRSDRSVLLMKRAQGAFGGAAFLSHSPMPVTYLIGLKTVGNEN